MVASAVLFAAVVVVDVKTFVCHVVVVVAAVA